MCVSVRLSAHSINFTLGEGIAEDPSECSVECEFGRMSGYGFQYELLAYATKCF